MCIHLIFDVLYAIDSQCSVLHMYSRLYWVCFTLDGIYCRFTVIVTHRLVILASECFAFRTQQQEDNKKEQLTSFDNTAGPLQTALINTARKKPFDCAGMFIRYAFIEQVCWLPSLHEFTNSCLLTFSECNSRASQNLISMAMMKVSATNSPPQSRIPTNSMLELQSTSTSMRLAASDVLASRGN